MVIQFSQSIIFHIGCFVNDLPNRVYGGIFLENMKNVEVMLLSQNERVVSHFENLW